jgi:hypothetical protein
VKEKKRVPLFRKGICSNAKTKGRKGKSRTKSNGKK